MNTYLFYIYLNAILYIVILLFLLKFNKKSTISIFLLFIWAVSAASSILYYPIFNLFIQKRNLEIDPYIYLFILSNIFFIPIYSFKNKNLKNIYVNINFLRITAYIISILSIIPFIENIFYTITNLGVNTSQFGENYGENVQYMSYFSQILYRWSSYFSIINSVLFFFFLTKKNESKYIKCGLLISMVLPILGNLNGGSRFVFVTEILYIIYLYILFYHLLDVKLRKKILLYIICISSVLFSIFIIITIFRFNNSENNNDDYTLFSWIALYSGESYLNFNDAMWNVSKTTNGDNCFFIFKHLLGTYDETNRNYLSLENIVHIRMNVYYTFIGDLFVDFGKQLTAIIIIFSAFIMWNICRFKNNITIERLILFCLYSKICLIGFTYYTYMNNPMILIYTLLFVLVLYFLPKKKYLP